MLVPLCGEYGPPPVGEKQIIGVVAADLHGIRCNALCRKPTPILGVQWFSTVKIPAYHELLVDLVIWNPKGGLVPVVPVHHSTPAENPYPSWRGPFYAAFNGAVVVPAGSVLALWGRVDLDRAHYSFYANLLEVQCVVVVPDGSDLLVGWDGSPVL